MMQIHVSKRLGQTLKPLLAPAGQPDLQALQWYAHLVTVADADCVIVMEQQSRYALIFCDLSRRELANFPDMLKDRLWREVALLAQLESPLAKRELAFLIELAAGIGGRQSYSLGTDSSVLSHIRQVKEQLEYLVYDEALPLPVAADDAVRFGLAVNDTMRSRKSTRDWFVPLEVFRDFWLGLLDHVSQAQAKIAPERHYIAPNVIAVDFARHRSSR